LLLTGRRRRGAECGAAVRGEGDAGGLGTNLAPRDGRGDALQALRGSTKRHVVSARVVLLPEAGARVRLGQNGSGQLFNFEDDSVAADTLDAAGGGTFTRSYVSPTRRRESSSEDYRDPCRDVQPGP
jgi:hypothetical protein